MDATSRDADVVTGRSDAQVLRGIRPAVSTLFDAYAIQDCVYPHVEERAPVRGKWSAPEPHPYGGEPHGGPWKGRGIGTVEGARRAPLAEFRGLV